MADTIVEMSEDDLVRLAYERRMKRSVIKLLETDTKYAVCLVKLHSAVTPADYPTLGFEIKQVTGIQDVDLLIDFQTRATLPVPSDPVTRDTKLQLEIEADLNIVEKRK